ncbi:MAG TPA: type II CAAX endopeptidase family protein [Desulfobacteraceae bacterium]|nr:type II CAAX endopeptidase family protein [Desulfobacteraceae bacterium]
MADRKKGLDLFLGATLIVLGCEMAAFFPLPFDSPLAATAAIRLVQIILLAGFLYSVPGGARFAGVSKATLFHGIQTGAVWSLVFGTVVVAIGGILFLFGINPLTLVSSSLPQTDLLLFFLTGGVIAPLAEELYFRGVLHRFLRQYGVASAVVVSTLVFASLHCQGGGVPVVQVIGGLVFALSFERSNSLAAPVVIHMSGNLALFSLSLL